MLLLLRPFSLLYVIFITLRRAWYQAFRKKLPVPVVVVGNITVGGSGKTPVVIALIEALQKEGFKPGVISRGFGGCLNKSPTLVSEDHQPHEVGDEPLMIFKNTHIPVVVAKNRFKAAEKLLALHPEVNILLSDDGLQHYRLPRQFEIVMVDVSTLGNQRCLPEGPLREPMSRLESVNAVLTRNGVLKNSYPIYFKSEKATLLSDPKVQKNFHEFAGANVHAVAGIAHPVLFFNGLERKGLSLMKHPFRDHHRFVKQDLQFKEEGDILMTAKDAVKCAQLNIGRPIWVVDYQAKLPHILLEKLVKELRDGQKTS